MHWLLLGIAILLEVAATTCLKMTNGWTRWVPTVGAVLFFPTSTLVYALALKKIPVSVAYAVWSGLGTVGMALIGWWLFQEEMNITKAFFMGLILVGITGLHWKS